MTPSPRRAAIYARVSTLDQEPENQLAELRRYVEARGWTAVEFVDRLSERELAPVQLPGTLVLDQPIPIVPQPAGWEETPLS